MRIPSYDDLTPSIPDIGPSDALDAVGTVLPASGPVVAPASSVVSSSERLFAALHGDDAAIERLVAIARDFSPRIERYRGGTVVLDVAGLQRLLGDAAAIAADLHRAGAARVGVARSQIAARLLARAHAGVSVALEAPDTVLAGLPIDILRRLLADEQPEDAVATGRGPRVPAFDVLGRWGLTTIGELAALPATDVSMRLGAGGLAVQRLARGLDPRPLVPDPGTVRFVQSFELEWPIDTLEPLSFVLARLLDPLSAALERADRGAVALHLDLRLTNRTHHVRLLQLPSAMRDAKVLRTLLLLDLESHPPPAAIDVVAVEIDPAPARIVQYSLLERAVPSPETLATLMARLAALVGETRCGSPVLLDTHRPDAFAVAPVTFDEASPRRSRAGRGSAAAGEPPAAMATAASAAYGGGDLALRRFRPPVAVRVTVERGRPVHVAIDRRGMPGGVVQRAAGPWRSSGGWWDPVRWHRDEWDVALGDGSVCRLFRDRDGGQWFMEGVFD